MSSTTTHELGNALFLLAATIDPHIGGELTLMPPHGGEPAQLGKHIADDVLCAAEFFDTARSGWRGSTDLETSSRLVVRSRRWRQPDEVLGDARVAGHPRVPLGHRVGSKNVPQLWHVMASIGARVRGTPALICEDGVVIGVPPDFDPKYASSTYGPAGKPGDETAASDSEPSVWLTPPRR